MDMDKHFLKRKAFANGHGHGHGHGQTFLKRKAFANGHGHGHGQTFLKKTPCVLKNKFDKLRL